MPPWCGWGGRSVRTITLELVRHGPAHNQLLSPLTQYLALCENHPAVTLQLPLEHHQMLYRLSALAYRAGKEAREFQVRDTARLLADLLALIPGLTADMNRHDAGNVPGDSATHLRLVLSASELALLPFELALAPMGLPGAGQPLLLQSLRPLSITRETRRVAEAQMTWPDRVRVLFVVASPAELPPPPAAAHLLALRRAIEPWVGTRGAAGGPAAGVADGQATALPATHNDRLERHLTVLANASLEAVEDACAHGGYTHVHILAHGGEYQAGYDTRFGLLLHDPAQPSGEADRVSGERLATALRCARKGESGRLARPAVVTLASCHSGNVGSVTGVGASIAHALHADGIPLVVASQFPLSYGGSVRMVEMLYEGLFAGEDPRRLLIDLRRALHTEFPETHDWASLTAYSSLPPNFDDQLASVQIQCARRSLDVALDLADEMVTRVKRQRRSLRPTNTPSSSLTPPDASDSDMDDAMRRVREARARLDRLRDRLPGRRARIVALLASADKREAALEYESLHRTTGITPADLETRVWAPLERACRLYDQAFGIDPGAHWAVVQFISLSVVLRHAGRPLIGLDAASRDIVKLWVLAEVQSLRDELSDDFERRAWALGNLVELYLLAPAIPELLLPGPPRDWRMLALDRARQLATMVRPNNFEVFSTRRQIVRYLDLYSELCAGGGLEPAVAIAEQVVDVLPAQTVDDISRI